MVQSAQGITPFSGQDRQVFWILSRCFVRQNVFEVAEGLPESKRKSALALLVRKWSPFPSTQFAAHWVGHRATVYAWDGEKVAAAIAEAGLNPVQCSVWPETFFREPLLDGVRLAAMSDGLEGQVWREGLLVASRWWPTMPSPRDWMMFLRASGTDMATAPLSLASPAVTPLLPLPWTVKTASTDGLWGLIQNSQVAAIAAAVVAAPFLYFLTEAAVLTLATFRAESAIAGMSAANASVRSDRSTALASLDTVDSYLSLETFPPQFELMAAAENLLRDKKVSIAEWTYDAGTLDIVVQADRALEAPFFIEIFEGDDHFSNVSGSLRNQARELHLKMQVDSQEWPHT